MIDKNIIDPNALQFYRLLKEAGFSAYFVGGAVRDLLLGKNPKDFDIATNATPHQIKRVIPYGRIIGRRFRHVILERDGGRYEIVTFRGPIVSRNESTEEIAQESQEESQEPENNDDQEQRKNLPDLNQFGNAQQDAIRRDFTINALFYDPDSDELVDYVEGKFDIDRKMIRTIGDAAVRMEEDPIRILRAIRHKAKLDLSYDQALENAMKEKAPLLEETSKDRIREEFLKICLDRSLGAFLLEARRLGIIPYVAPWLASMSDEEWEKAAALWAKFAEITPPEFLRPSPDIGLSFMMIPLIQPLVLDPYKQSVQPGDRNYLPDMKYFLSCEPLRDYLLRNLRISRAQTDHVVRTLFYWSRMTGLWIENGPPRRVIGRLFQHPPALVAARMAKIQFLLEGKEIPEWITDLADFNPRNRNRTDHQAREHNNQRREDRYSQNAPTESIDSKSAHKDAEHNSMDEDSSENIQESYALPIPTEPMIWNGPLHAPVLRPTFSEEPVIRWARKNQTVRAFRPSGIPNQPTAYAMLKSHLVGNYKPELATPPSHEEGGHHGRRDNRDNRDNPHRRGRDNRRSNSSHTRKNNKYINQTEAPNNHPSSESSSEYDEDSFGNTLRPGEAQQYITPNTPEPVANDQDHYDDADDNIGNRLDAPPTSGHVGVNGEGVLGRNPGRNQAHRGGPRRGPSGGGKNRNGRSGGRGRGGSGSRGNFPPRQNNT